MQLSAQVILEGNLLTDDRVPVSNTRIGVAGGPADVTDSKGQFKIRLPLDFIEGERVLLFVSKEKWVINHPLDGEWNLPNIKYQEVQTIDIIIVPFGSKALWSHERIEKHIALLSEEITKLKKDDQKPSPLDFSFYLDVWATKYGFTPQEVKSSFDDWAAQVEDTNDYRTIGLKAFYEKNLLAAAFNFEKAALQGEKRLKELYEINRKETLATYENWKDAGNAYYNMYQFHEALTKYLKADSLIYKDRFPKEWAEIKHLIGTTKWSIGNKMARNQKYLNEAIEAFELSLQVRTRENLPLEWAGTHNNLGNVYYALSLRTSGHEKLQLLKKAFEEYSKTAEVYTIEYIDGFLYPGVQNNLGVVLTDIGRQTDGEESTKFFVKALLAFNNGLRVSGIKNWDLREIWATTQINLANTYSELARRTRGDESKNFLNRALSADSLALQVFSCELFPYEWSQVQNNLGSIFTELGVRTIGQESLLYLKNAVDAFTLALQILNSKNYPRVWATTQKNLGGTFKELASKTVGEESERFLLESYEAYELAKKVLE
jgi:tetratricopeptide (TPR) repeat protein